MRQQSRDFETWVTRECFKLSVLRRTGDDQDDGWAEGKSSMGRNGLMFSSCENISDPIWLIGARNADDS